MDGGVSWGVHRWLGRSSGIFGLSCVRKYAHSFSTDRRTGEFFVTRLAVAVAGLALVWMVVASPVTSQEARTAPIAPARVSFPAKADPVAGWQARVTAGFHTRDCRWWSFQINCQHLGTDIAGLGEGTPVYAPVGGAFRSCTYNGESGPFVGWWIEYTADDGAEILINHFRELGDWCGQVPGTRIEAGALLGTMRADANHIHLQVTQGGALVDFEEWYERY